MPQSSRHKSHKHSKHSSKEAKDKDYSDSEEDVKMKEKSSRCDSTRAYRDSASGEKHKISSQARKGKDGKDLICDGNGEASEEYVSSKRRKEKALLNKERVDVSGRVSGDRWDAAGEERGRSDRNLEKEINKVGSSKIDLKLKESNNKGGSLRVESKSKSKRHESGTGSESKEENVESLVVEKDESKSKRESKRKSERASSEWREGKELKDKECWLDKDKKGGQDSKYGDAEVKAMDGNLDNNQSSKLGDTSADRQCKRGRENTAWDVQDDLRNPELEKELEKRVRRTREGFTDRENDDKRLSSRGDCNKDVKFSDERHMGGIYGDRCEGDGDRDDRHDKHREDADKDVKHREDSYKEARYSDDIYREDGNRDGRRRGEKYREDGERENRCKDDKYREASERDGRRRNDNYSEDAERESRDRDDCYRDDTGKDGRRNDDRYHEDGDKDYRRTDGTYREGIGRHKEEKHWDDIEKYSWHKDRIQGDDCDREKRHIDSKYGDERGSRYHFGDKSDTKHSRDDGYAGDRRSRKSSMYDDGVSQDDGIVRCRDDQGRRRSDDGEDYGNTKSTQDQRSDAEKKSAGSVRMDGLTDRGRSTSRNADVQISSSHSRRRSSPRSSFHATREHNRLSNETKYSDYAHEDKIQDKITSTKDYASSSGRAEKISSSRSLEKLGQNDSHLGELSAERHLKSDIHTSSVQPVVYKSPSSSADRRRLNKSNVRQSLDIEDSTQCNSGSRDANDYSGKEGRGSREPSMDVFPRDELSRADGDTLSVSSPFSRNSHLSSSAKSFLPPPHFRTGMDSRRRRIGDPNVGRVQGNAWRGVPNWPSPVENGFIPFPHMPPPVGFHSMMQPFPVPSIFAVRPSMDLNHSQSLYHMPDADRFSGHGPPMGWPNPVDDSRPLPLHGWNASNAVFSDESHIYERPDWNPSRTLPGGHGWETNGDLWKAPSRTASMERPSSSEKQNNFVRGVDEVSAGQNEQTQHDKQADSADISQLSDSSEKNAGAEAPNISQEETRNLAKMSRKDDVQFCHVYLSKLDISADITEPELFKQWASIIDTYITPELEFAKILYMEQAVETQAVSPGKTSTVPLFAVKNDFIFQKAMSHYKRQTSVFRVKNEEKLSLLSTKVESIPKLNQEELNEENDKVEEPSAADDMQDIENGLPNSNEKVEHPNCYPMMEGSSRNLHQKLGVPVIMNITEKSEELIPALDHVNTDVDMDSNLDLHEHIAEKNHLFLDNEGSNTHLLAEIEELHTESAGNVQELKSGYTKCSTLLNSDVTEACEEIMPESNESGLVNLSRIHNSPESIH